MRIKKKIKKAIEREFEKTINSLIKRAIIKLEDEEVESKEQAIEILRSAVLELIDFLINKAYNEFSKDDISSEELYNEFTEYSRNVFLKILDKKLNELKKSDRFYSKGESFAM